MVSTLKSTLIICQKTFQIKFYVKSDVTYETVSVLAFSYNGYIYVKYLNVVNICNHQLKFLFYNDKRVLKSRGYCL